MTEVTVETGGEDVTLTDQSAHDAAVAEGAAAVQAEQAAEAASEATAAAEAALMAAQANIESSSVVTEAAVTAEEAAASASAAEDRIYEAVTAQIAAIGALVEELRASRQPAPVKREGKPKSDREPGSGGVRLVRR